MSEKEEIVQHKTSIIQRYYFSIKGRKEKILPAFYTAFFADWEIKGRSGPCGIEEIFFLIVWEHNEMNSLKVKNGIYLD